MHILLTYPFKPVNPNIPAAHPATIETNIRLKTENQFFKLQETLRERELNHIPV